jgi:hypothetical protein
MDLPINGFAAIWKRQTEEVAAPHNQEHSSSVLPCNDEKMSFVTNTHIADVIRRMTFIATL